MREQPCSEGGALGLASTAGQTQKEACLLLAALLCACVLWHAWEAGSGMMGLACGRCNATTPPHCACVRVSPWYRSQYFAAGSPALQPLSHWSKTAKAPLEP